jgi:hypothetical protein
MDKAAERAFIEAKLNKFKGEVKQLPTKKRGASPKKISDAAETKMIRQLFREGAVVA